MARRMARRGGDRITVRVPLDRRGAEAFQLEARRLARRYGVEIKPVEVKRVKG
jgi:hypothetical protein